MKTVDCVGGKGGMRKKEPRVYSSLRLQPPWWIAQQLHKNQNQESFDLACAHYHVNDGMRLLLVAFIFSGYLSWYTRHHISMQGAEKLGRRRYARLEETIAIELYLGLPFFGMITAACSTVSLFTTWETIYHQSSSHGRFSQSKLLRMDSCSHRRYFIFGNTPCIMHNVL